MDGTAGRTAAPITLQSLRKEFAGGTVAVTGLDLTVAAGEMTVLIGPSGCGKSTVLRMINRLIEPSAGRILLDGADVTAADPVSLRRQIGYVIQHVGLFPHQTIRTNIGTVPRLLGWDRRRIRVRVDELLDLVGLPPGQYGERYPHELSGGQRQRVGVARALAADPVVLLMDEPFSAVDPIVRGRLQEEFLRLQEEVRKTIVLVTHDLGEAVRLADRIAVLSEGGVLEQYAAPAELLGEPATDFVREFVGTDRGIRRLAVTPIGTDRLVPESVPESVPDSASGSVAAGSVAAGSVAAGSMAAGSIAAGSTAVGPTVPVTGSLYDALAAMLVAGADRVAVTDPAGAVIGELTRDAVFTPATSPPSTRRA